ncbi:hypothetical protein [Mesorhizobium sp. ANAO-SY3R2]
MRVLIHLAISVLTALLASYTGSASTYASVRHQDSPPAEAAP